MINYNNFSQVNEVKKNKTNNHYNQFENIIKNKEHKQKEGFTFDYVKISPFTFLGNFSFKDNSDLFNIYSIYEKWKNEKKKMSQNEQINENKEKNIIILDKNKDISNSNSFEKVVSSDQITNKENNEIEKEKKDEEKNKITQKEDKKENENKKQEKSKREKLGNNENKIENKVKNEEKEKNEKIKEEIINKEDNKEKEKVQDVENKEELLETEIEKNNIEGKNENIIEVNKRDKNEEKIETKGNIIKENNNKPNEKLKFPFIFDKKIISNPIVNQNKNIPQPSNFEILEEYKKLNYINFSINSNDFIIKKKDIINPNKTRLIDLVYKSYEQNILLPVNINVPLRKLDIKVELTNEIETINNIIEGNKNVNIFEKIENEIINQKPVIIQDKNKEQKLKFFDEMINYKNLLYSKDFTFDNFKITTLNIDDDINLQSFTPEKSIVYKKKNIKSFNINSNIREKKIKFNEEKDEIRDSLSSNNERRINRLKYSRKIDNPNVDHTKLKTNYDFFYSSFINKIDEIYENTNIKIFSIENNLTQKINIDDETEKIKTEIFYIFKSDNIKSPKIELDLNDNLTEDTIEDINDSYSEKYIVNIDLYNDYTEQNDIDVLDDIDIINIFKKYKNYQKKEKQKNKDYLLSGDASIELMKSTLTKEKYNNNETSLLHSLSTGINSIYTLKDNEELKNISDISSNKLRNKKYIKCSKKLKKEYNRSLINRSIFNIFNNKSELPKSRNNSEIVNNYNDINNISLNSESKEKKEKEYYENVMKNIKKVKDIINKKEKKAYLNKKIIQQENELKEGIKRDKKFNYLYSGFIFAIPLLMCFYNKFIANQ